MTQELIADIFIPIFTLIASVITSASLINWRLKKLEEKVDKHNQYSDKIASMTNDISCVKVEIGYIKEMIEELKNK